MNAPYRALALLSAARPAGGERVSGGQKGEAQRDRNQADGIRHEEARPEEMLSGHVMGIARHVSPEGCQFAITGTVPNVSCRLALATKSTHRITGSVRWVVEDRIGFAFDQTLDPAAVTELRTHFAVSKPSRLELCSQEEDA